MQKSRAIEYRELKASQDEETQVAWCATSLDRLVFAAADLRSRQWGPGSGQVEDEAEEIAAVESGVRTLADALYLLDDAAVGRLVHHAAMWLFNVDELLDDTGPQEADLQCPISTADARQRMADLRRRLNAETFDEHASGLVWVLAEGLVRTTRGASSQSGLLHEVGPERTVVSVLTGFLTLSEAVSFGCPSDQRVWSRNEVGLFVVHRQRRTVVLAVSPDGIALHLLPSGHLLLEDLNGLEPGQPAGDRSIYAHAGTSQLEYVGLLSQSPTVSIGSLPVHVSLVRMFRDRSQERSEFAYWWNDAQDSSPGDGPTVWDEDLHEQAEEVTASLVELRTSLADALIGRYEVKLAGALVEGGAPLGGTTSCPVCRTPVDESGSLCDCGARTHELCLEQHRHAHPRPAPPPPPRSSYLPVDRVTGDLHSGFETWYFRPADGSYESWYPEIAEPVREEWEFRSWVKRGRWTERLVISGELSPPGQFGWRGQEVRELVITKIWSAAPGHGVTRQGRFSQTGQRLRQIVARLRRG